MKKGIFLPMLAIMLIIIIPLLGSIFYSNTIKSRIDVVGEKSAEVLNAITKSESDSFYAEESVKLAWCDALTDLSVTTGVYCSKILSDQEQAISKSIEELEYYPLWDIDLSPKELLCRPVDYKTNFESFFRQHFDDYLLDRGISFDYDLEVTDNGVNIIPRTEASSEINSESLSIKYIINNAFNKEIQGNFEDYTKLMSCLDDKDCLISQGANLVFEDGDVSLYEYESIVNPCTLEEEIIRFGFAKDISKYKNSGIPLIYRPMIVKNAESNPGVTPEILASIIYEQNGFKTKINRIEIQQLSENLGSANQEYGDTKLAVAEAFSSSEQIKEYCFKENSYQSYDECKKSMTPELQEKVDRVMANAENFKVDQEILQIDSETNEICKDPEKIPIGSDGIKDEVVVFKGPIGCEYKNQITPNGRTSDPYCLKVYYCVDGKLVDLGFKYDLNQDNNGNYWAHTGQGNPNNSPTPTPASQGKEFFTFHYLFQLKDWKSLTSGTFNEVLIYSKCRSGPYDNNAITSNSKWDYEGSPRHPFHCYAWAGAAYFYNGFMMHNLGSHRDWIGRRERGHGCVEMYGEDMLKLYPNINLGDPISIYDSFSGSKVSSPITQKPETKPEPTITKEIKTYTNLGIEWVYPLRKEDATGYASEFNHPYDKSRYKPNRYGNRFESIHRGMDIYTKKNNAPVYAMADGEVIRVSSTVVYILHTAPDGKEYTSAYVHVIPKTKLGPIKKGELIATVDYPKNPHLHLEMYSKRVDEAAPSSKWGRAGTKHLPNDEYLINPVDIVGKLI